MSSFSSYSPIYSKISEAYEKMCESYSKACEAEESSPSDIDSEYENAVRVGDKEAALRMIDEEAARRGFAKKLHRVSPDEKRTNSFSDVKEGVFFTDDLGYYKASNTGYSEKDAKSYYLNPNAVLFDPVGTLGLHPISWSRIPIKLEDMERLGIDDETDWDEKDGWGNTSTVGLSIAGKNLGYDGTVIRDVPNDGGWGKSYAEYAIYDSRNVRSAEIEYDDAGNLIPLSKRFDFDNPDVRY